MIRASIFQTCGQIQTLETLQDTEYLSFSSHSLRNFLVSMSRQRVEAPFVPSRCLFAEIPALRILSRGVTPHTQLFAISTDSTTKDIKVNHRIQVKVFGKQNVDNDVLVPEGKS